MMTTTASSPAPKNKELGTAAMFGLMSEIGFMIAIPAALFGFGGAYLDKTLNTIPLFIVVGLLVAITTSALAVWHRIKPFLNS